MNNWVSVVLLTLVAGLAMPIGAYLASLFNFKPKWLENEIRHSIIAFGGGALLSAVALVLIPEGTSHLSTPLISAAFLIGGLVFMMIDKKLAVSKTPLSNLLAMLTDFIPEALALGTSCALGSPTGPLLAFLIFVQNVPEGFNAYKEMIHSSKFSKNKILLSLVLLSFLGPIAGLLGFYVLVDYQILSSLIMVFASGGILYIVFKDIAPQANLEMRWAPAMGALLGFLVGIIGHQLI